MSVAPGAKNHRVRLMSGWRKPLLKARLLKRVLGAVRRFRRDGRFLGMFPWTVQVQTKSDCNSACRICPHRITEKTQPQGEMSVELFHKVVDECLAQPNFSGLGLALQNEPLVDPRLPELMGYFTQRRPEESPAILFLATNGIELTPRTFARLRDAGLDFLQVSVNADSKEEYERLSPGRSWETLQRNLGALMEQDLSRVGVHLSFVRTRTNHEEIQRAVRAWRKRGVQAYIHHLSNRAGSLETYGEYFIEEERLSAGQRAFRAVVKRLLPVCPYVFFQASVLWNGDVLVCTHDWNRQVLLGNVAEQSLSEIWNGQAANAARRAMLEGRFDGLPSCRGCTVYDDLAFT